MNVRIGLSLFIVSATAFSALADPLIQRSDNPIKVITVLDAAEPPVTEVSSPIKRVDIPLHDEKTVPATAITTVEVPQATDALAGTCTPTTDVCPVPRLWIEGGIVCWWLQDGPLKFPLVTTGNTADGPLAGAIGQAGTRVLFGGNDLNYGRAPGFRLTVGGWHPDEPIGLEGSVLWLDTRDVSFVTASNGIGAPALFLPIFNLGTGNEGLVTVASPVTGFAGNVAINSKSRLWGWEANGLLAITRGSVECSVLAGFRFAELKESITIQNNSNDLVLFTQASMIDQFEAVNRFYGGQVGGRVNLNYGRWFAGLTAKVALGNMHEEVNISGVTTQVAAPPIPAGTFAGAVFTQPSNIGARASNEFAVLSELNLRAGCQLMGCLRAFVGYDLFAMNRVVRPGDQIDRANNASQSAIFGVGSLTGSARPAPLHSQTDFCAQGFTAGLEFRY